MKSVIETATEFMERIAADNSHGYSQANRWGNPDYDCSSLVITAWEKAGVPVKSRGATYTGNMKGVFLGCGFRDVTASVNLNDGTGLKRGDVLLNEAKHTAMYTGMGMVVHARSSEGNTMPGDQSGNEIRVQGYWNYPWDCVLRYFGGAENENTSSENGTGNCNLEVDGICGKETWKALTKDLPEIKLGSMGHEVRAMQSLLNYRGVKVGIDGDFGDETDAAVRQFQRGA